MVNREDDNLHNKKLKNIFVLFGAVMMNEVEIASHILDDGVDVNVRLQDVSFKADEKELKNATITSLDTPLLVALKHNSNLEIIRLLLENGADTNMTDQNGKTSLNIAAEKNLAEILKLFNAQNSEP